MTTSSPTPRGDIHVPLKSMRKQSGLLVGLLSLLVLHLEQIGQSALPKGLEHHYLHHHRGSLL